MNRYTLGLFFYFFLTNFLWAQPQNYTLSDTTLANQLVKSGQTEYSKSEFDKAIEQGLKALAIQLQILRYFHLDIAQTYSDLGVFYSKKGQYKKAIDYSEKALAIRLKILGTVHLNVASCYNNLGSFYNSSGDFDKAIAYHNKALAIRSQLLGNVHQNVAASFNNLGNCYISKEDYDKAIAYHQKSLEINLLKFGEEHQRTLNNYNSLGISFLGKKQFNQSFPYYEKTLSIRIKLLGHYSLEVADSYNNLGEYYYQKTDYTQAVVYHQKSLDVRIKILGVRHPDVSLSYRNIASTQIKQQAYEQARIHYQKALFALVYEEDKDLSKVNSLINLINTLHYKASFEWTWYLDTQDITHLFQAVNTFREAINALNYQNNTLTTEGATELKKQSFVIYEGAIKTHFLLANLTKNDTFKSQVLGYNEQSKSTILQAQIKEADALRFAGIPDDLLQKEYNFRIKITGYEKQKQDKINTGKSETDSTVLDISSKLFDFRQQYDTLKAQFERDYPQYYRLKYEKTTVTVAEVQQKLLANDQTLVSYFVGDSSIFTFVINKTNYSVHETKKDSLDAWVKAWRFALYDNKDAVGAAYQQNAENYAEYAHKLYEKLILPIKNQLQPNLIIVPDGVLGYIPFEALLVEKPTTNVDRYQLHHYLIKDYSISYNYSATLWQEMKNRKHNGFRASDFGHRMWKDSSTPPKSDLQNPKYTEGVLIAFAPTFGKDTLKPILDSITDFDFAMRADPLSPLKNNIGEVQAIQKIMGGKTYTGKFATKEMFLAEAAKYRIIHLATHGKADDRAGDYAFLAFQESNDSMDNERLYVKDLYNCALNADLVVLSACETGVGKWQRGEGIISLARAFAYAGTKSIVTTLWQIDDARTKNLMELFYTHLKSGLAKDAALRQAKLDYLNTFKSANAAPFRWAGFIAIGDMEAMKK